MNLIERQQLAENTVKEFADKPFAWGSCDCGHLATAVLKDSPLKRARKYRSAAGALRAIRGLGFDTLEALMDAHYSRIAPAAALVGDVIALPAENDEISLGVYLGEQRLLAFVDLGDGRGPICALGPIQVATHAWRVDF